MARTEPEFVPQAENECAGLVLLQNSHFHFCAVGTKGRDGPVVRLIQRRWDADPGKPGSERAPAEDSTLAEPPIHAGRFCLEVGVRGQAYSFYVATAPEAWQPSAEGVDGRILNTPVAGGFFGAYTGLYASRSGQASDNVAD